MSRAEFQNPYEVPAVQGTEGWEQMYPYYVLFNRDDPRRMEDDSSRFWFRASIHLPDPLYPLDSNLSCAIHYAGISTLANRTLQVPMMRGFDFRVLNGHVYLESVEVEDPQEMEQRAQVFGPRIGYILEHWEQFYRENFVVSDELVAELSQIEFADLVELYPEEVIPRLNREYPGLELYRQYLQMWDIIVRMGQQTLKALLPSYGGYLVFMDSMRKLFPGIPDKAIAQMLQGFDSRLFRPLEELQQLAHAAVQLGLSQQLRDHGTWAETRGTLTQSEAGRSWLERLERARDPWFEVTNAEGWQKQSLSWNDDLDVPLASIRGYVAALEKGETIAMPRETVLAARDAVTNEYRGLIQTDEDRQAFDRLLVMTRALAPAAEDHNLYDHSFFHSLYDRKIRGLGQVLTNFEILDDSEDVFLLNRQELDSTVWEVYHAWSRGKEPAGKYYWPGRLARRRQIMERFEGWEAPPALGKVPQEIRSPFAIVHFGMTRERVESWLQTDQDREEGGQLRGFPGCGGVVEGIARVCRSVKDLGQLQPGEIMVTPSTAPTWAPAFQFVSACVTDTGGVFCHAAIIAREYGLPTVVGTGYGTQRISSGDRIRVDGDNGVVELLERAE